MPNLIILGAGFSKPAGLPLGNELFPEVIKLAKYRNLYINHLKPDIENYLYYQEKAFGTTQTEVDIDFERFISFLDLEHYLWLKGSDTWKDDGNKSQIVIRNLIALCLYLCQESITDNSKKLYRDFLRILGAGDLIISFNYDTILENLLDELLIPYRLFPTRLINASKFGGTVKLPDEEITILKVHGSIDWFDKTEFDDSKNYYLAQGLKKEPRHKIFNDTSQSKVMPLVDCPYPEDSPLLQLYRGLNLDNYFNEASFLLEAPVLLTPSTHKHVYLNPIREFWHGFNRVGGGFTRMAIIGFFSSES